VYPPVMGNEVAPQAGPQQTQPAPQATADPQAAATADQMMAQAGNDPEAAADLIRKNPQLRDPLLAAMHQRLGNAYVQQVIHALGHPAKGSADTKGQLAAILADTTQEKTQLATSLATDKTGIANAIARGTGTDLRTAADAAATAISRADASVDASRTELDAMSADDKKSAEYASANASTKSLDDAVNNQAVPVLNAIEIPGAPIKAAPPSDSLGSAIKARAEHVRGELDRVSQLVLTSQSAGALAGAARLAAADQVRTDLLGMSAAERAWVLGRMAGVADDILDYYKGKSAALRAQAGSRDFGSGSNAAGDSAAQGGFSHGTQIPNLKSSEGAKDDKVNVPFTTKPIPGELKGVNADPSTGGLGVDVGGKRASGGVGGDVRADDGSARLEGFNGNLGINNGVEGKGAVTTKVNGGYTQTTSPPSFDGAHWTLSWSVGVSAGLGQTKTVAEDKGTGTSASLSGKASGSVVKSGTTVYPDQAAAQKAYDDGAFALVGVKGMDTLPDKQAATDLKEGESVDIAYQGDVAGGVGGGGSNVSITASGGGGLSTDVKVVKLPGNKVRATIRGVDNAQGSLSVGTVGVTGGAGVGGSKAISTTFDFDLSTPAGQAAYAQWVGNHPHLAPNPGTPGVSFVSSGSGQFTSTNVGIGVGIGPVNGTGTNTSTSGEFTEDSADGKSRRNTIVGSQTDSVKGFNPIDPSKTVRTDSLEITTDSKGGVEQPAQYVIKTAIQARTDAQASNAELGKVLGEPQAAGKLDGNSSGTTGKWSVEGTYTAAQMKQFETDVASGKVQLVDQVKDTGTPGANLKAVLSDPKSTEHDKQMALAVWFSKKGPDASGELRGALGPPQMNVALDGDKYLTGAQAQGVFEGKRQELEDRLLDPALAGDAIKALLRDVQGLYAELIERRDHIANPDNYKELPLAMRHELVKQTEANYQKVALLRDRVAGRAKEDNLGDPGGNAELNKKMQTVNARRKTAQEARGHAVDARAKHNGALDANHGPAPRSELDKLNLNPSGAARESTARVRGLYAASDTEWTKAQGKMDEASLAERNMFKEDALAKDSQDIAAKAADAAANAYVEAAFWYQSVTTELLKIMKMSGSVVNWQGYDRGYYGTID